MNPEVLVDAFKLTGSEPPPGVALKPATVAANSFDPASVSVVVDGDTEAVAVLSLVGGLAAGTRVMVLFFPPQGAYVFGVIQDSAWVDVSTFETGWGNLGGSQTAQYRRDGHWVTLRGIVARTSGASAIIFTLPAGFQPSDIENFAVDSFSAEHSSISVDAAGVVSWGPSSLATPVYVSLSGVRFWAA